MDDETYKHTGRNCPVPCGVVRVLFQVGALMNERLARRRQPFFLEVPWRTTVIEVNLGNYWLSRRTFY